MNGLLMATYGGTVDVALVIVNYRSADLMSLLLQDIARQKGVRVGVVCVDASHEVDPGDVAGELDSAEIPWVLLRTENLGYGRLNNTGIEWARTHWGVRFALISNPDVRLVREDVVDLLVQSIVDGARNAVCAVGPRIMTTDGNDQNPLMEQDFTPQQLARMRVKYLVPIVSQAYEVLQQIHYAWRSVLRGMPQASNTAAERAEPRAVFCLHGAFVVLDIERLEGARALPVYDERMFLYLEELVLARKLAMLGFSALYDPRTVIQHSEDGSTRGVSAVRRSAATLRSHHASMRVVLRNYYADV